MLRTFEDFFLVVVWRPFFYFPFISFWFWAGRIVSLWARGVGVSPSKLNSSQPVLLVICVRMYVYVFYFVWGGVVGEGERERERDFRPCVWCGGPGRIIMEALDVCSVCMTYRGMKKVFLIWLGIRKERNRRNKIATFFFNVCFFFKKKNLYLLWYI